MTPDGPRVVLAPAHAEPDLVDARPPAPVAAPSTPAPGTHRVEAGETLYRIARGLGITPGALAEMNGIAVSTPLSVGQVLIVPAPAGKGAAAPSPSTAPVASDVESADSHVLPPALAGAFDTAGRRGPGRIEASVLGAMPPSQVAKAPVASLHRGSGQLQWPLRGVLYARFGRKGKSPHDGIDLAAPAGTPVRTAGEGSVLFAGPQQGYGLLVIVEHAHGLVTVYAHNRDLRVRTGQQIREGQVIATVGESGKTSGPHLHFEVRQDGAPVDPLEILGPPPAS
jgi:murein DD-endopeptidase MepM/ murein hydrolase activator NlpD